MAKNSSISDAECSKKLLGPQSPPPSTLRNIRNSYQAKMRGFPPHFCLVDLFVSNTHRPPCAYLLVMVDLRRVAPLAARPGAQHTVLCSLRHAFSVSPQFARKPIAPAIASTLGSLSETVFHKISGTENPSRLFWRRERDSNPRIHSCITRFRAVRNRPLCHLCKNIYHFTRNAAKNQGILRRF